MAFVLDHRHNLWNDVSGATDNYPITNPHPQPLYLIRVVQGGVADGHPRDKNRFEPGHRRNGTGAADLKIHPQQLGAHLLGGKLSRNGPSGRPGYKPQKLLMRNGVYLEDNPVDIKGQVRPLAR